MCLEFSSMSNVDQNRLPSKFLALFHLGCACPALILQHVQHRSKKCCCYLLYSKYDGPAPVLLNQIQCRSKQTWPSCLTPTCIPDAPGLYKNVQHRSKQNALLSCLKVETTGVQNMLDLCMDFSSTCSAGLNNVLYNFFA